MIHDRKPVFIEEYGLWFPWNEQRPDKTYSALRHHLRDMDFSISLVHKPSTRTCVQAGGHIGVWPIEFAKKFGRVMTFEAEKGCYDAMVKNVKDHPNIEPYWCALGEFNEPVTLKWWSTRTATATVAVDRKGGDQTSLTECCTIDSLELNDLALLYLDVEGYEPEILRGAQKTIAKYKPVVTCEHLPNYAMDIATQMAHQNYYAVKNKIHPKCRDFTYLHEDDKRRRTHRV